MSLLKGKDSTANENVFSATEKGVVPATGTPTGKFLKDDGTWDTPAGGGGTVDVVSNVATSSILGRVTAGSGDSEELTASQVRTLINVADGATANSSDGTLLSRANHTGTQTASTISDFNTAADARVTAKISDIAYGGSWDGNSDAPTKNVVYDKVNTMFTGTTNITVGTSAPGSPATGDLWVDTN